MKILIISFIFFAKVRLEYQNILSWLFKKHHFQSICQTVSLQEHFQKIHFTFGHPVGGVVEDMLRLSLSLKKCHFVDFKQNTEIHGHVLFKLSSQAMPLPLRNRLVCYTKYRCSKVSNVPSFFG